jgi:methylene-tetrahydromethanopterin dehydrogenase
MDKPHILHLFTPAPQASPFDVNMAYDAGYDAVVPYTSMSVGDVATLTQDAIFSRGPKGVRRTGIFIGGRDLGQALEMLDAARKAMVPPFEVSVFADPSGAFTTAAAAVAAVERRLRDGFKTTLSGRRVLVLGGTGPVGTASAVLAAQEGAKVQLASSSGLDRAQASCRMVGDRYGLEVEPVLADRRSLEGLVTGAEIVIAAAKAGVEVLPAAVLAKASSLLVAADVNAVPPAGVAGVGVMDDGAPLAGTASGKAQGIGALAVGNIKYQVERGMFEAMLAAEKALYLDFRHAFAKASELASR